VGETSGDGVGFGVGVATPGIPVNEGTGVGIRGVGVAAGTGVNDVTGCGSKGAGTTGMTVPVVGCTPPPPHAAIVADAASAAKAERFLMPTRYPQCVKIL
jgi:hypothetical protein